MKASAIFAALQTLVDARQPVFIWGGPGLGKSSIVRKLAAVRETLLQDIRALLLDPVDLRGLPFLGGDGRAKWATPAATTPCGITAPKFTFRNSPMRYVRQFVVEIPLCIVSA